MLCGVVIALRFTLLHFMVNINRATPLNCPRGKKTEAMSMDIWFDEWLDSESERLRANEAREVRRQRTIANWRAMRFWQGRK